MNHWLPAPGPGSGGGVCMLHATAKSGSQVRSQWETQRAAASLRRQYKPSEKAALHAGAKRKLSGGIQKTPSFRAEGSQVEGARKEFGSTSAIPLLVRVDTTNLEGPTVWTHVQQQCA